uniref:Uncharacterized protein n=1 Tax=Timema bartmani TaxID=61472 RepID=A0A7R9ETK9_9NEOP|nr:unnamed protein product [Timema bartmani]
MSSTSIMVDGRCDTGKSLSLVFSIALPPLGLLATKSPEASFEDDADVSADYPTFDGFSEGEEDSEDYLGPRARRGDKPPEVSPDAQWILGLGKRQAHFSPYLSVEVQEGFGDQINLCRDRGMNPGAPTQRSDTLPLDHQLTLT